MTQKHYTLDELLAQSEGAYPLSPEEREWVDAPAVGREIVGPPHPGELLHYDVHDALNLSLDDAAARFGVSANELAQVLACYAPITAELAATLEKEGFSTARAWLAMQQNHDDWFRAQVQIGLDSANAGNLIPATEVEAEAAAWRAKVQEAHDDNRPTVPHDQVMAEAQALIDTKKKGQGDD